MTPPPAPYTPARDSPMPVTAAELFTRYPQLRGLDDALVQARADDFEEAIRARYHITLQGGVESEAIDRIVRRYFGWWMLYLDHRQSESTSTTGASADYGHLPWPAEIAEELAPYGDRLPGTSAGSRSAPVRFVW